MDLRPLFFINFICLTVISGAKGVLMLIEVPMLAFKFKSFGWKGNETALLFIIISAILVVCFKLAAVSLIIVVYVVISVIANLRKK